MIFLDVDTAVTVPVNVMPLTDDTDFKTREVAIVYNQAGMDLVWNFITSAGVITQTAVTPTTAGDYDWTHVGDGMYKIEIPASAGALINNDTEGYGYFSGVCTGVLPWRSPTIGFRAAALNNALIDGGDNLDVNATQVGGQTASASGTVTFPATIASTTNITAGTITTTTNLTNLPSITAGWLTAAGIAASALNGKGDWSTHAATDVVSAGAINTSAGAVSSVTSVVNGVTLANGAHGGAAATITLSDYSDFQGAAGDPWATALPGAYGVGTAGYIVDAINSNASSAASAIGSSGENLTSIANLFPTDFNTATVDGAGNLNVILADGVVHGGATATFTMSNDLSTDFTSTNAMIVTIDTVVDGIQTDLSNGTDGLGALKTLADAIKAVTDQFGFTVANQVDANALTGGGGGTAADIADAVWDEAQADHTTAGTFGKYLDTEVSGVSGGGGIYTLTVPVEDSDGNAVQGARITISGTAYSIVTNNDGDAPFNVNNGTYTLVCAPPAGYDTPSNGTATVSGSNKTATAIVLTETNPSGSDVGWAG